MRYAHQRSASAQKMIMTF